MGLDVGITLLSIPFFFFFISAAVTMGTMRLGPSALSEGMVDSGQTIASHYLKIAFPLKRFGQIVLNSRPSGGNESIMHDQP